MKAIPENFLSLSRRFFLLLLLGLSTYFSKAQIGNYISNGSFEDYYTCSSAYNQLGLAKYWNSIDSSITTFAGGYRNICNGKVPVNGSGYQYPRTGNAYILNTFYCFSPNYGRGYMKNRLKANLMPGKSYCVTFYISIADASPRGMDGFGIYFGDNSIDTIKYCNVPLTYINPQVKNPLGNVITDTLNWVAITGTFVASGTEKYALIGNFLADNAVTTASINTPSYPQYWTDVYVDDVSCIEVDLPAYAGPDKSVVPGDSVFIGREPDFAIDPGCTWYQFPNMATPINTISGMWVKPTVTTTYVVKQILDCSSEKWDTVIVYIDPVGLKNLELLKKELKIYPVPANDFVELRISRPEPFNRFTNITICNNIGQTLRREEISFASGNVKINTTDLVGGSYLIIITDPENEKIIKKLVIAK